MGLRSDPKNGAKTVLKDKFPNLFVLYHDLESVGGTIGENGIPRSATSIAVDGNVALMRTHQNARSLDEWIESFTRSICEFARAASIVVLVFDEPQHVTLAKLAEQQQRDARVTRRRIQCSEDLDVVKGITPTTDNYTLQELQEIQDVHTIKGERKAKPRFFDEVVTQAFERAQAMCKETTLILDGIDRRGADRPIGQERNPVLSGNGYNDDGLVTALTQREEPIGEGDLKLAAVQREIRKLVSEEKLGVRLHLTWTIDTDSICVELLDEARRRAEDEDDQVIGLLCMPDTTNEAKAAAARAGSQRVPLTVIDYATLFERVTRELWQPRMPTEMERRTAINMLVAGIALSGCDFVPYFGLTAAMIFDSLPSTLTVFHARMVAIASTTVVDDATTVSIADLLKRLVRTCAVDYKQERASRKRVAERIEHCEESLMLRAAWCLSYWRGITLAPIRFGFPPLAVV